MTQKEHIQIYKYEVENCLTMEVPEDIKMAKCVR